MTWYTSTGSSVNRILGEKQRNRYDNILSNKGKDAASAYKTQIAGNKGYTQTAPAQPAPTPTPTPAVPEGATTLPFSSAPAKAQPASLDFTSTNSFMPRESGYKKVSDFLPQSVGDVQESVGYQYRMGEGQKALDRMMASRGLTNSGAELSSGLNLANQLSAEEYDRMTNQANTDVGNYYSNMNSNRNLATVDAARFDSMANNEYSRAQEASNTQWGRLTDMLNYFNSQNPMQYAMTGTQEYTGNEAGFGKSMANYISNDYQRYVPVSGGGSYVPMPVYTPPVPEQAPSTVSSLLNVMGDY